MDTQTNPLSHELNPDEKSDKRILERMTHSPSKNPAAPQVNAVEAAQSILGSFVVLCVKLFALFIRTLPPAIALKLIQILVKIGVTLQPKFQRIGMKNLQTAFPSLPEHDHHRLLEEHYRELARLIRDSFSLRTFDKLWFERCVSFPEKERYLELHKNSQTGILIATGHLGSFELLAHCAALLDSPLSFVVRSFRPKALNDWWCSERESLGNKVINRSGAFKEIVRTLRSGRDVGILFDQNVTRNHAVFVPWFSELAATTRALALAGIQLQAPIVVSALCYAGTTKNGEDSYTLYWRKCPVEEIYQNSTLTREEKVERITSLASQMFIELINQHPAQWFWLHRRWRTKPEPPTLPTHRT
ncbi:MAG: hypothetical protein KDD60_01615 [Bdellovibrionales bacterium]|nr:hypothetical protein [Bdellovibrionales bacterium]